MKEKIVNQYIIGHRGYSSLYPENTSIAFDKAIENNFDGVEIDIHLTKDGHLVIIHDENTIRTSDTGLEIKYTTLEKLQSVNIVSKFSCKTIILNKEYQHDYFDKSTILTLETFLDKYSDKFKVINIEVKTDVCEYKHIEIKIVDLLNKYFINNKNKIILTSSNFSSIKKLHELKSGFNLGYIIYKPEVYNNLTPNKINEIREICKYISIWDKLYLQDKDLLDQFKLKYIIWQWRLRDEINNYNQVDKDNYFKFLKNKDVYAQILDYRWD
ncbi:MAG: glycerophosphodiester phosphodiesterase [Mycoplasmataceae bacterium]|nr:glycerophosphodiester phosphodiesterase [Mycoplasmataceae bacterium]